MKKLLILGLMLVAPSAFAQTDPGPNGIGFYWDEAGICNCLASAPPYTLLNAYLLATRTTQSAGMAGWEAEVAVVPAPAYPPAYVVHNAGENALTAPIFQVGMANVLPYAPVMKLLTVSILNFGTPFILAVGPCTPSSFGGLRPGYADGADPGLLIGLTPSLNLPVSGRPYFYVVAAFGTYECPPLAAENDSWGCVKGLYR